MQGKPPPLVFRLALRSRPPHCHPCSNITLPLLLCDFLAETPKCFITNMTIISDPANQVR
jgi:hypothetical protein